MAKKDELIYIQVNFKLPNDENGYAAFSINKKLVRMWKNNDDMLGSWIKDHLGNCLDYLMPEMVTKIQNIVKEEDEKESGRG